MAEIINDEDIERILWADIPDGNVSEDDEEDYSADEEDSSSAPPTSPIFIVVPPSSSPNVSLGDRLVSSPIISTCSTPSSSVVNNSLLNSNEEMRADLLNVANQEIRVYLPNEEIRFDLPNVLDEEIRADLPNEEMRVDLPNVLDGEIIADLPNVANEEIGTDLSVNANGAIENIGAESTLPVFINVSVPLIVPEDDDVSNSSEELLHELAESVYSGVSVWRKRYENTSPQAEFHEETGTNIAGNECTDSPVDYFLLLFPEHLFELLVFQTNLYATQEGKNFVPTNIREMKTFIAINLLMGIKRLPSFKDYWSARPDLRDEYISSLMPMKRFSWLLGHLHFNDNYLMPKPGETGFDKLYKIRTVLNTLSDTFAAHMHNSENMSVDESMIKFKGRSTLKQYMPMKPIKRGYKVWVRAGESGYVYQFQIYTGKNANHPEVGLGQRVVREMSSSLIGKNYKLYFDNFFTSMSLMHDLKRKNIWACGVVRSNRKDLANLKSDKTLKRGDSDYKCNEENIIHLKWKDNKAVNFLSNFHNPIDRTSVQRKNKDGSSSTITCPQIVKDYNKHMGYVDKADQLKSSYEIKRRSKRFYMRIFWHFLDVALTNSFIIFKNHIPNEERGSAITLKIFRLNVIQGLIAVPQSKVNPGRKRKTTAMSNFKKFVPQEKRFAEAGHMPVKSTSKRCAYCSTAKEPHRSRWTCETCLVALCMDKNKTCFKDYHKA